LVSFDGVWTCSYGYHLLQFGDVNDLVPPWSHLFLSEEQMREVLAGKWPVDAPIDLPSALRWIYRDRDINRLGPMESKRSDVPQDILNKALKLVGMNLEALSLDTVKMFAQEAATAGFKL
jgi:hypothetical protein